MKTFRLLLAILLLPCFLYAQNTWEGDESSDWSDENNWSDGSVPTTSDDVVIQGDQSNYPVVDGTAECGEIEIEDDATLTINAGADFTIEGDLIVGEGSSGEFILNGGTVSVDGDFLTETDCTVDINGGILNIDGDWASDSELALGTIELSGGAINVSGDVGFSDGDVTGTMEGSFQLTIGGDFIINDNGWTTTGGTIILTAEDDGDCSLESSDTDYDFTAYNLIINGSGCDFTLDADVDLKGSLTITAGTLDVSDNDYNINLEGNWVNNGGTYIPSEGTLTFDGSSSQIIGGSSSNSFNDVVINNSSGVLLNTNPTVNGTLTLSSGNLDLNGSTLTLGPDATVIETEGNCILGSSGTATITTTLSSPSSTNVGGLGAIITSNSNLGSTVVTKGTTVQSGSGNTSIKRYYDITPTNNSGLNATLVFCYDDSELNGITESELVLFRSTDSGTTWTMQGGTVDIVNNTVTLSNINAFSNWTLGSSSSPLPVELISFAGSVINNSIYLNWQTETEVNNYGFNIERKIPDQVWNDNNNWKQIGFVDGHGNTNSPKEYLFIDDSPPGGVIQYRLKQIDNDGSFEYSDIIEVESTLPSNFELLQNYPNPFNPSTIISWRSPAGSWQTLKIYDVLGNEVATLVDEYKPAGKYEVEFSASGGATDLPSGVYIYKLQAANFNNVKKMILLK